MRKLLIRYLEYIQLNLCLVAEWSIFGSTFLKLKNYQSAKIMAWNNKQQYQNYRQLTESKYFSEIKNSNEDATGSALMAVSSASSVCRSYAFNLFLLLAIFFPNSTNTKNFKLSVELYSLTQPVTIQLKRRFCRNPVQRLFKPTK